MDENEKFCITWSRFGENTVNTFSEIYKSRELADVTIVCEDHQYLAHKLVIMSSSSSLRSLLLKNTQSHPLIFLVGVDHTNLELILHFMYHGEVAVAQENIETFLQLAENLKVKGLSKSVSDQTEDSESVNSKYTDLSSHTERHAEKTLNLSSKMSPDQYKNVKDKQYDEVELNQNQGQTHSCQEQDIPSRGDLNQSVEKLQTSPPSFGCILCKTYTSRKMFLVREHLKKDHLSDDNEMKSKEYNNPPERPEDLYQFATKKIIGQKKLLNKKKIIRPKKTDKQNY